MAVAVGATVALSWANPAWAGEDPDRPPVQRPSTAPAQASEPAPVDAGASEPEPEPSAGEAAPVELDEPVTLPSYTEPELVQPAFVADQDAPLREVPRDGRGMLVLGGAAFVGAAGAVAGTVVLAQNGVEADVWAGPAIVAGGLTIAGSLFLRGGVRRGKRLRAWQAEQPDLAPQQGNGIVAGGGVLLCAGAGLGMFGTIGWAMSTVGFQPEGYTLNPAFPAMLGVGLASLATGSALMIVGMKRHKQFQAWRRETAEIALVPSFAPLPGGAQIGLVGRF